MLDLTFLSYQSDTVVNVFTVNDKPGAVFLAVQLMDGSFEYLNPMPDPSALRVIHLLPSGFLAKQCREVI